MKRYRGFISTVIAGSTRNPLLYILLFLFITMPLPAQNKKTLEKQRKELLNEIEETSQLLTEKNNSISAMQNRLSLIAKQIDNRKQVLIILDKEIGSTVYDIQAKELKISDLERKLEQKKNHYAISIRQMHTHKRNSSELLWVMSAGNLSQSYRRMLYLQRYAEWRQKQGQEIQAQQVQLAAEKKALEDKKREKEGLSEIKKREEVNLEHEEVIKKSEVVDLQKNAKQLEAVLNKKRQQAEALDRKMAQIVAAEVEVARKAALAKKSQTTAATKGGYMMTKEEQVLSANFESNKGKLPFPLKGAYRITEQYGIQQYGDLKNVQHNSNGIKIETDKGNQARTVFDGVVSGIFLVPGYQTSVIVRHGNYLTLYANLRQVNVQKGDKVKTGQEIGAIYTDPDGITALYFELWKEQMKQNPEPWLNK
ncbi:M23 family peptidase [Candidatus Symbiothrix dinenymphae]|nr:M23 family peptidase [Candidatus Symbiothrix dinenymphae]